MTMRALTLWQPWASIVASGIKRIENRPWAPPGHLLGMRFAIHAGSTFNTGSADKAERLSLPGEPRYPRADCPQGAILATARLVAVARTSDEAVRFANDETQRRWFFGPFGWILDDIRKLSEPIEIRGRQKLWKLPAATSAEVMREVEATE